MQIHYAKVLAQSKLVFPAGRKFFPRAGMRRCQLLNALCRLLVPRQWCQRCQRWWWCGSRNSLTLKKNKVSEDKFAFVFRNLCCLHRLWREIWLDEGKWWQIWCRPPGGRKSSPLQRCTVSYSMCIWIDEYGNCSWLHKDTRRTIEIAGSIWRIFSLKRFYHWFSIQFFADYLKHDLENDLIKFHINTLVVKVIIIWKYEVIKLCIVFVLNSKYQPSLKQTQFKLIYPKYTENTHALSENSNEVQASVVRKVLKKINDVIIFNLLQNKFSVTVSQDSAARKSYF